MKTLTKSWNWGAGIALTVALVALPVLVAQEHKGTVTITDKQIIMHPGTELSESDAKALDEVLQIYDLSLYKINTYKDGKLVKTQGELPDVALDKSVVSQDAAFRSKAGNGRDIQFVNPHDIQVPGRGNLSDKGAREFVSRLKPILEKYAK